MRVAIAFMVALLLTVLLWLSRSTVVLTAGGVYDSIQLPMGAGAMRWRADQATVATAPQLDGMHGPVVRPLGAGRYEVSWYCRDRSQRMLVSTTNATIACDDRTTTWHWRTNDSTPVDSLEAVERVAVVSDLEGDTAYFGAWGRALGVLDSAGHWAYGRGHVVILGDATDRGRWVYPLLWTLYRLEGEAQAAGGALHYVLGNHEQYDLVGITKDVEAEHHYAMRQLDTYDRLLDSSTVLGRWLRIRPVVLRLGRTLFVHGGISPETVRDGSSMAALNERSRQFLAGSTGDGPARDAQLGPTSPTQYRGFVMAMPNAPLADRAHVDAALRHFAVDRIVVGHTEVDSLSRLHDGRVIDVNASVADTHVLVLKDDTPHVESIGLRRQAWTEPKATIRSFSLLNGNDWRALLGVFGAAWR